MYGSYLLVVQQNVSVLLYDLRGCIGIVRVAIERLKKSFDPAEIPCIVRSVLDTVMVGRAR